MPELLSVLSSDIFEKFVLYKLQIIFINRKLMKNSHIIRKKPIGFFLN